jgi:hypothetical protein
MIRTILMACVTTLAYPLFSQSDAELLRYSLTNNFGTARNIGLGGAFNALGGDFSSLSTNPAGIARFSGVDIHISPAFHISNVSSEFLSANTSDNKLKFNIYNLGIILPANFFSSGSGSALNLGVGINRIANFNEQFFIGGFNPINSLLNAYAEKLQGESTFSASNNFPFDASLAFVTELLAADGDLNYYTATNNGNVAQEITMERSGGIDEFVFSVGGSINEKLQFGGTIGLPILNFSEDYFHRERDINDMAEGFIYFDYDRKLRTNGVGLNLKLGVIAEISENIRLGAAFHTPTIYWLNDRFNAEIYSDFDSFFVEASSPEGSFEYRMVTPWKMNLGSAFIHPDIGLLSLEYELTNPGSAKYRFSDSNPDSKNFQEQVNALNKDKHKATSTLKAGVEGKIKDFRIRAGVQYRSSPFDKLYKPDAANTSAVAFSGGAGYRGSRFYADVAYQQWNNEEVYLPYTLRDGSAPAATHSWKRPSIVFTFGFKL